MITEEKKPHLPTISLNRFEEEMGCDPETWSNANVLWYWKGVPRDKMPSSIRVKIEKLTKKKFELPEVYVEYWMKNPPPL